VPRVLRRTGLAAVRADWIHEPGYISTQIIELLIAAPMVIADITEHNPNVFYELAIRHAFRKPVVILIEEGQRIPFRLAPLRVVTLLAAETDSRDVARAQIVDHMRALLADPLKVESPVTTAVNREDLRSGGPIEQQLARVFDRLEAVEANLQAQRVMNIAALEAHAFKVPHFEGFTRVSDIKAFKELVEHFGGKHFWEEPDFDWETYDATRRRHPDQTG